MELSLVPGVELRGAASAREGQFDTVVVGVGVSCDSHMPCVERSAQFAYASKSSRKASRSAASAGVSSV